MRWRCGDSTEEWRAKLKWHRWFAWHWVNVDGTCVWLDVVERRRVVGGEFGTFFHWEYRFPPVEYEP